MSVIVRRIFVVGCLVAAGVLLIHYHDNSRLADFLAMPIGPKCNATGSDDWKVIRAGDMTPDQMFEYLKWTNSSSCQLAYDFGGHVMGPAVKKGIDGQKTVCMDQHVAPVPGSCLIYSFGINNEWSFDKHFDEFGCHVYAFDPSMNMASGDYTPRIHFSRIGLSSEKQRRRNWKLLPLDSIYSQLKEKHGSKTIDYLKIDIEGDEWNALPQILRSGMMDKVKQLGAEFHLPLNGTLEITRRLIVVIQSLEDYGMVRFTSRVNMWMTNHVDLLGRTDNHGYEIAWYNQKFVDHTVDVNDSTLD